MITGILIGAFIVIGLIVYIEVRHAYVNRKIEAVKTIVASVEAKVAAAKAIVKA